MTLRNRFTLVGLGIIIFLIITPALVLYARGFKIDWENKTFVKTGALVVRSEPDEALIYLNDELLGSDTPANIRFLLPDDYNVRVEQEGYQSWTKRLSIKSQLVTWANENRDFITLFLSNPILNKTLDINNSTISETSEEIIYLTSDQIGLINVNDGDDRTLVRVENLQLPLLDTELKWLDSRQTVNLFTNKSTLDLLQSRIADIDRLETESDRIVVLIDNNLYFVRSNAFVLIDEGVTNFTLKNDEVWYVLGNSLKHYNLSSNTYNIQNESLPTAVTAQVIRSNNQIYLILDRTLYHINGEVELINSGVDYAYWDGVSSKLVFANNNEIYVYDPNFEDADLIVRSLTQVQQPILNIETGYIFYQNEGKIKAIELDGRDHRNIFTIADAQNTFAISKDGKHFFTIGDSEIKNYTIR